MAGRSALCKECSSVARGASFVGELFVGPLIARPLIAELPVRKMLSTLTLGKSLSMVAQW
jgi:hypothetical protein